MPKVVSITRLERFRVAGVELLPDWDFYFQTGLTEDEIITACRGADFLLVPATYPPITARILENIPSVCLVQSDGAGYNQIDVAAAARLGLPVANAPGENATTVAEFTIGLIIALQRHIVISDREIKAGNYHRLREQLLAAGQKEISDIELGLVGLGAIGRQVARLAGIMGVKVSYYDAYRLSGSIESELAVIYKPLDELLATSDVISLHLPLNENTRGLISSREFRLMPPGTIFINTARGELVDQAALAEALESSHLGGAAIDTLAPEPPPPDHPLLRLSPGASERVLLTPHLAGVTRGAFKRMLRTALTNMVRVFAGEAPLHVVNGILDARRAAHVSKRDER